MKKPLVRDTHRQILLLLIWEHKKWLIYLWLSCAGNPNQSTRQSCKKPCSMHTNCANCTSQAMECMWCSSAHRCVDSTAYVISFPYGQCLEWQTGDCVGKCLDEASLKFGVKVAGNKLPQIGFCKQSIFITEREEVTGWKELKVEGVFVSQGKWY